MASTINPVGPDTGQIIFTTAFTMTDGQPGTIEAGTLEAVLQDPSLGVVVIDMTAGTVKVQHNGSVGSTFLEGAGDGNLEPGARNVSRFTFQEAITFAAPLGAVAGAFTPGAETGIS